MRYDVFLSYRRDPDRALAVLLERGLARLACPFYRPFALWVYRDETKQAADAEGLRPALERALASSRHFVLIASPEAARSRHVRWEVGRWLELHGTDHLWIVLAGGELEWNPDRGDFARDEACPLPEELIGRFAAEPIWIDLRSFRGAGREALQDARFLDGVAALSAPMRGFADKAAIHSEERRQRTRLLRAVSATAVLLLALALGVAVLYGVAHRRAIEIGEQRKAIDARNDDLTVQNVEAQVDRAAAEVEGLWQEALRADIGREPADLVLNARRAIDAAPLRPAAPWPLLSAPAGSAERTRLEARLSRASLEATRVRGVASGLERYVRQMVPFTRARGIRLADSCVEAPHCAAFTPDGRHVLAGGAGCGLWELGEGRMVHNFDLGEDLMATCDIAADGRRAVGGMLSGRVVRLDLSTGSVAPDPVSLGSLVMLVRHVAEDERVLVVTEHGAIVFIDGESGAVAREASLEGSVKACALSPSRRRLLVVLRGAQEGTTARLLDATSLEPIASARVDDMTQTACLIDDDHAVIGGLNGLLLRWNAGAGRAERIPVPIRDYGPVASANVGTRVFLADARGVLLVMSADGSQLAPLADPRHKEAPPGGSGWSKWLSSMGVSPDQRLIAVPAGRFSIWDVADVSSAKPLYSLESAALSARVMSWSPDGSSIASGGDSPLVELWDSTNGERLQTFVGLDVLPTAIAFSVDGSEIAAGDEGGVLATWDVPTGRLLHRVRLEAFAVTSLAFGPLGDEIAVAQFDGTASRFGRADMQPRGRWSGFGTSIAYGLGDESAVLFGVSFQPGGACTAYRGEPGTQRPRRLGLLTEGGVLKGHPVLGAGGFCALRVVADDEDRLLHFRLGTRIDKPLELRGTDLHALDEVLLALARNGDVAAVVAPTRELFVWSRDPAVPSHRVVLDGLPTAMAISSEAGAVAFAGMECLRRLELPLTRATALLAPPDFADLGVDTIDDGRSALMQQGHSGPVGEWDLSSGLCRRVVNGPTDAIFAAAASPCGLWRAASTFDGLVFTWPRGPGDTSRIDCLDGMPAGLCDFAAEDRLILGGTHGRIVAIDPATNSVLDSLQLTGPPPFIYSRISADGAFFAVSLRGELSRVDAWNFDRTNAPVPLPGREAFLSLHPVDKELACAVLEGSRLRRGEVDFLRILIVEVATGLVVSDVTARGPFFPFAAPSADGRQLVVAAFGDSDQVTRDIVLLDVWTGRRTAHLSCDRAVRSPHLRADGSSVVALGLESSFTWRLPLATGDAKAPGDGLPRCLPPRRTQTAQHLRRLDREVGPPPDPLTVQEQERRGLEYLFGLSRNSNSGAARAWLEAAASAGSASARRRLQWILDRTRAWPRLDRAMLSECLGMRATDSPAHLVEDADQWLHAEEATSDPLCLEAALERGEPDAWIATLGDDLAATSREARRLSTLDPALIRRLIRTLLSAGDPDLRLPLMLVGIAADGDREAAGILEDLFTEGRHVAPHAPMADCFGRFASSGGAAQDLERLRQEWKEACLLQPDGLRISRRSEAELEIIRLREEALQAQAAGDAPKAADRFGRLVPLLEQALAHAGRPGQADPRRSNLHEARMACAFALLALNRAQEANEHFLAMERDLPADAAPVERHSLLMVKSRVKFAIGAHREAWLAIVESMRLFPAHEGQIEVAAGMLAMWGEYGKAAELLARLPATAGRELTRRGFEVQHAVQSKATQLPVMSILEVFPGSAAAKAGISAGDAIIAVDDRPPASMDMVRWLLGTPGPHMVRVRTAQGERIVRGLPPFGFMFGETVARSMPADLPPVP